MLLAHVILTLVFAATPDWAAGQTPVVAEFEDVFEWQRFVELEQTDNAIAFKPRVRADPLGGWIVLDSPEGQVRLHDKEGRLKAHVGRGGKGPGEFSTLTGVLRTDSGDLVTIDMNGRFARWSSDGSKLLHEFRVPLNRISGAERLGLDSLLVLTPPMFGRGTASGPVLHVIDLARRELVRSFYEPTIPRNAVSAWATFIGGGIAAGDDVIGVTLPLLDSLLLLFDGAGRIGRVPVGILGESTSIPDGRADRAAFREWANQLTIVGPVYAVAEGWIIPLVPVGHQEDGVDLLFLPHGSTPVLVHDAPIVVGTDQSAGEVVFDDPDRLEPQYLRTARIRGRN